MGNNMESSAKYQGPTYASEYNKQFDENAKNLMNEFIGQQVQKDPALQGLDMAALGPSGNMANSEDPNVGGKFNSHWKRQEHLKNQWTMEDMDPEAGIKKDQQ